MIYGATFLQRRRVGGREREGGREERERERQRERERERERERVNTHLTANMANNNLLYILQMVCS